MFTCNQHKLMIFADRDMLRSHIEIGIIGFYDFPGFYIHEVNFTILRGNNQNILIISVKCQCPYFVYVSIF